MALTSVRQKNTQNKSNSLSFICTRRRTFFFVYGILYVHLMKNCSYDLKSLPIQTGGAEIFSYWWCSQYSTLRRNTIVMEGKIVSRVRTWSIYILALKTQLISKNIKKLQNANHYCDASLIYSNLWPLVVRTNASMNIEKG